MGLIMELWKPPDDEKSKRHKRASREVKSREATGGGGWSRSSDEVPVMGMERRASPDGV